MGRVIGLDIGEAWIGVAVGDSALRIATPRPELKVVDRPTALTALQRLIESENATALVIGMPYTMRGDIGPQGKTTGEWVLALKAILAVPIHLMDERLSSVEAHGAPSPKSGKARQKAQEDSSAAALILQSWFDRQPVDQ